MPAAATAQPSRQRFIPELLVVHAEELAHLWGRRRQATNSPALTLRDLADLNERIEAHTQGLLVARDLLAGYLEPGLAAQERDEVFAAAYALLRANDPKYARVVVSAFNEAKAERLAGLRDALSLAGIALIEREMQQVISSGDAPHAVSAAAVLASHKRLDPVPERITELAGDADPNTATVAWQVVAALGNTQIAIERTYVDAIKGKHAGLRSAAIGAAVWRGEFWVAGVVRRLAEERDPVGLAWYAAIADADAIPVMQRVLAQPVEGVSRARIAARCGHPALMQIVLDDMTSADPLVASAAGEAFTRVTGIDVAGKRTTLPVKEDADEFEREFADDVWLPDAARAQQAWTQRKQGWENCTRWCRGCDISTRLTRDDRYRIDLEALGDFGARAALAGERVTAPPPIS
jgi:uncharacterized protein (TIGR02270 family)